MARTAIFIDGAYLDKTLELAFSGIRINYKKLIHLMTPDNDLLRAYYYHCLPYSGDPPTQDELARVQSKDRFYKALSNIPRFTVKLGTLVCRGEGRNGRPIFVQKLVDVMMSVDMVQIAATRQVDHAIIITGDSDFVPAIQVVKTHGVLVSLWHAPLDGTKANTHPQLLDICDERIAFTSSRLNSILRER